MTKINLSDGEWKLMKPLWASAPRTIAELVRAVERETGWSKTTVFVMLKRLVAKGAVAMEEGSRAHLYYPLVSRADVTMEETASFLSRVYDGSIGMMVSSLADGRSLSADDIAELRAILDSAEAAEKGR